MPKKKKDAVIPEVTEASQPEGYEAVLAEGQGTGETVTAEVTAEVDLTTAEGTMTFQWVEVKPRVRNRSGKDRTGRRRP